MGEPLRSTGVDPAELPARSSADAIPSPSDTTVVALVTLAGALGWLVLFYPGLMSPDSAGQLAEARAGVFSDAHPPLMAVVWRPLDRLAPGPFGMLLVQTAVFWTGLGLLVRRLHRPAWAKSLVVLAIGFAPPLVAIAGAIWKDVLMTALLVLAFGLAGGGRGFWVVALLAGMTRHNAIVAVAGAVLLHSWATGPSLSGSLRAVAVTLVLFVAAIGLNAALVAIESRPTQMIALFDVVGMAAVRGATPDLPACHLRATPIDAATVARSYDPRSIIYSVSPGAAFRYCSDAAASSRLVSTWLATAARDPLAYLTHRRAVFAHLLGIHGTPGNWIMTRSTYDPARYPGLEAPAPQSARLAWLERAIVALNASVTFRPWIYGLIAIAACAIAALRRLWWPFCIAGSGIAYQAALLVVAPSEDYRYSLWMIMAGLIAAVWVAIEPPASRNDVT